MIGTIEERFWAKVEKTGTCWLWTGSCSRGYGKLWVDGKNHQAHRVAYELMVGDVPDGLELDHLCRVRHCVNPAHLEPVTGYENTILRGTGVAACNLRKNQCIRGHAFTSNNARIESKPKRRPRRQCRECDRARKHAAYHRLERQ